MRPRGSFGEVGRALLAEAQRQPGTVREIAARANVGYQLAKTTATRYVQGGQLVKLNAQRPAVLGAGMPGSAAPVVVEGDALLILTLGLWRQQTVAAQLDAPTD
jgi:hypothetical protein